MFIDDMKNRYTYLNSLKNIVHEEGLERPEYPDREITLHPAIVPVLDHLLKERPTWRYKSTQNLYTGRTPKVDNFIIYDGDEQLGRVWAEVSYRDGSYRYNFDNFRLQKSRERGHANYSIKPDVAAKRIVKAFHLKTPMERAVDAFNETRGVVHTVRNNTNWPYRRAKSAVEDELFAYAVRNWETIKHHLGADVAKIDFPALAEANNEGYDLQVALDQGEGLVVRIEPNGTYLTVRNLNNIYKTESMTEDTLTDHLRGALGLLKLVQDSAYIDGVGVRINSNLYFVTDKKDESNAK